MFEDWDDRLRFGVCYYLLVLIWKELGQIQTEAEENEFLVASGYYRDVGIGPDTSVTSYLAQSL